MRREVQYPTKGFLIGVGIGGGAELLGQYLAFLEYKRQYPELRFWDNVDWRQVGKFALVGGAIGGVAGYAVYQIKITEEAKFPFDGDAYLNNVLKSHTVSRSDQVYQHAIRVKSRLKAFLNEKFIDVMVRPPINWGSTARGTAIGHNHDFDLILPFRKMGLGSLEEMYNLTYSALYEEFASSTVEVRKQRHSIGITFYDESDLHFDIVPGREVGDFRVDHNLSLFKRPPNFWSQPSRLKTNVSATPYLTINQPDLRKVIKLLKLYRDRNGFNISSTAITYLASQCFERKEMSKSIIISFLDSLQFISEKLGRQRIIDLGNSNNKISDSIDSYESDRFIRLIQRDLCEMSYNERYLREIFA